jgi:hypothetical protein
VEGVVLGVVMVVVEMEGVVEGVAGGLLIVLATLPCSSDEQCLTASR